MWELLKPGRGFLSQDFLQWIGISVRFDAGGGLAVAQTCCSTGIKEGDEQPSREELIASLHLVNERNSELADEIKRLREEVLIARSSDGTHEALTSKLEMLMHDNRMLRHQLIPSIEDVHPDGLGARAPERTDGMDRDVSYELRAGLPGDHFVSSMKRLEALPHQHGAERKAVLQKLAADLAELREHVAARTAGRKPIASAFSATVAASHTVLKSATPLSSDGDPSTAELCTLRDEIQAAKLADLDSARKPTVWPRSCGARRSARRAKMFVIDKSTWCCLCSSQQTGDQRGDAREPQMPLQRVKRVPRRAEGVGSRIHDREQEAARDCRTTGTAKAALLPRRAASVRVSHGYARPVMDLVSHWVSSGEALRLSHSCFCRCAYVGQTYHTACHSASVVNH